MRLMQSKKKPLKQKESSKRCANYTVQTANSATGNIGETIFFELFIYLVFYTFKWINIKERTSNTPNWLKRLGLMPFWLAVPLTSMLVSLKEYDQTNNLS